MTDMGESPPRSFRAWFWRGSAPIRHAFAAGAIAGAISAGAGGRIVMRIIALVDTSRTGASTDNGIVGEITPGGTFFLFVAGTVLGLISGTYYLALRRWLPVPAAWRGLAFGAVSLLTAGLLLINGDNVDFQLFRPASLTIALFAALFFVNGAILAPLADRLHPEPAYGGPAWAPRAAAALLVAACLFGLLATVMNVRSTAGRAGSCLTTAEGSCVARPGDANVSPQTD